MVSSILYVLPIIRNSVYRDRKGEMKWCLLTEKFDVLWPVSWLKLGCISKSFIPHFLSLYTPFVISVRKTDIFNKEKIYIILMKKIKYIYRVFQYNLLFSFSNFDLQYKHNQIYKIFILHVFFSGL